MALRRVGKESQAAREFKRILTDDPLNLPVLRELSLLEKEGENIYTSKLERMLSDDQQYILDLANFYLDAGLPQDSLSILEAAAKGWEYPMVFYLSAYLHQLLGNMEASFHWRDHAQKVRPDRVFPNRLWEIIALNHALDQNPQDDHAKYYLGNFLYAHQRFEEAIKLWEDALGGLANFDVIYRNLGLAYWQQKEDPVRATEFFEKALTLHPNNQDLYIHLDYLYQQQGQDEKRATLLNKIRALDPIREDLRKRSLAILVDLGRYEEALRTLTEEEFVPLEMDQSFHWIYVKALLQRAEAHLKADRIEEAIADYQKALEFPQNHGVGKPMTTENAEILYHLGCAFELLGKYGQAIRAWQEAAREHHAFGGGLYTFVQMSIDKLGRYSELGFSG